MFAGQLIEAPVERTAEQEIVSADGQHLSRVNGAKEPFAERDFK